MRKYLYLILLLLLAVPASAQIKTITGGGFQNPNGSACAGCTLYLQLSQDATVSGTGQIIRGNAAIALVLDSNGNVPASSTIWGNDQLLPTGTYYAAALSLSGGGVVWGPIAWSLTGNSPINLSQVVAVNPSPIGIPNPALLGQSNTFTGSNTFSGSLTVSGAGTFTGQLNCKSVSTSVKCVDAVNTQGWAGGDPGAWINAADLALGASSGEIWGMAPLVITTQPNIGANGLGHTLKLFPGTHTTSATALISSAGSAITGSVPCGEASVLGNAQNCPVILKAANGSNLSSLVSISCGAGVICSVNNIMLDANFQNNPNAGVTLLVNLTQGAELNGVTLRNAGTHNLWVHATGIGNQSCCMIVNDSFFQASKADNIYVENSGDFNLRTSQVESAGCSYVVSTSGSTVTYVSGGTGNSCPSSGAWSTDSSLVNTKVILLNAGAFVGGVQLYTITAVGSGTLTVSPAPGTTSGTTLGMGSSVECNNSPGCHVGANTDVGNSHVAGLLSYGTTTGLGNATQIFEELHSMGFHQGWDIYIACYDTVGGGYTGASHIIKGIPMLGGTRYVSNLFANVHLQDCDLVSMTGNTIQGSSSSRYGLELTETAASRAQRNVVTGNTFSASFVTAPYNDAPVVKSHFANNRDVSGNTQIGVNAYLTNGDILSWKNSGGTVQGVVIMDTSNNVIFGADATAHFMAWRPNGIGSGTNQWSLVPSGMTTGGNITLGSGFSYSVTNAWETNTAPTIAAAGCGGGAAAISVQNGTAAFKINVGTTPGSACTFTMPGAVTGWNCSASDITTQSTSVFLQKQTGAESTTSVTITNFNDVAVATAFVASDILKVACSAD